MLDIKVFRIAGLGLVLFGMLLMALACGSDAAPVATSAPATAPPQPAPTATPPPAPTGTSAPAESTAVPEATRPAPAQAPEATPLPPTATALPTPTPVLLTSFDEYGFTLKLDRGSEVRASGWTESEPDAGQGLIALAFGGVNTNLVWGPTENRTPLEFVASTYNLLRAAQPAIAFETISEGEITVSGQLGVYGGFRAKDSDGGSVGGGLIGAWNCPSPGPAFRLTLTGDDATVVQLRFDRLLENFSC